MEPKLTILLDYERSYLSVAHLVRSEANPKGHIIRIPCPHFKKANEALHQLRRQTIPGLKAEDYQNIGAIVHDTVSAMATQARRALIAEPELGSNYWTIKDKLFPQLRDWGNMTDMIARLLADYASWCDEEAVPLILLCHERLGVDEYTQAKKGGPDLNNALQSEILENSDYVWRIWREENAVKVNNTQYPKDTHWLKMATSESKVTKRRIPPEYAANMPGDLPNPTLQKAFGYLGPFVPNVLTVFGPAGSGKTTFGTSFSDFKNWDQEKVSA